MSKRKFTIALFLLIGASAVYSPLSANILTDALDKKMFINNLAYLLTGCVGMGLAIGILVTKAVDSEKNNSIAQLREKNREAQLAAHSKTINTLKKVKLKPALYFTTFTGLGIGLIGLWMAL